MSCFFETCRMMAFFFAIRSCSNRDPECKFFDERGRAGRSLAVVARARTGLPHRLLLLCVAVWKKGR